MDFIVRIAGTAGPICLFLGVALLLARRPLGRMLFPALPPERAASRVAGIAIVPLALAILLIGVDAFESGRAAPPR